MTKEDKLFDLLLVSIIKLGEAALVVAVDLNWHSCMGSACTREIDREDIDAPIDEFL